MGRPKPLKGTAKMTPAARLAKVARVDAWENVITGHRTSRDKTTGARIQTIAPAVDRQKLEDIYHGDDMAAKIADLPAQDMVREWITLSVDTGNTADNTQAADDMLQALDDLGARAACREALTWASVFGGGMVLMYIDDGGGDNVEAMAEPVDESRIRKVESLDVYDRFEFEIETEYSDATKPNYGRPETYRLRNQTSVRGQATQPDIVIHESRILRFDGVLTNRRRKVRNNGWSDPVFTRIETVLADFGISWAGAAHLLADFAVGVFKSPGIMQAIATDQDDIVHNRMMIMDMCRSTIRMLPLDGDEDFERRQTPISGLPEMLDRFALRMSAAARMPITLMMGQSPSGLNNTAEGDIRFWYDQIGGKQDAELRGPLEYLIHLLFLSAEGPTRGAEPDGWAMDFKPLYQPTEKEQADLRKTQAETDAIYIDTGVLEPSEVTQSRFGGERYSIETQLDDSIDRTEPAEPEPPPAMVLPPVPQPTAPVEDDDNGPNQV